MHRIKNVGIEYFLNFYLLSRDNKYFVPFECFHCRCASEKQSTVIIRFHHQLTYQDSQFHSIHWDLDTRKNHLVLMKPLAVPIFRLLSVYVLKFMKYFYSTFINDRKIRNWLIGCVPVKYCFRFPFQNCILNLLNLLPVFVIMLYK